MARARRSATRSRRRRCLRRTAGSVRAAPAVGGLDQVEHRPHPGRGGHRGCDQDGDRDASRGVAANTARGSALFACGVGRGGGGAVDRVTAVGCRRPAAPRGCLLVRDQRHERARDPGGGATCRGCRKRPGAGEREWKRAGRGRGGRFGRGGGRSGVEERRGSMDGVCGGVAPWVVSARSEAGLRGQAVRLLELRRGRCGAGRR